MSESIEKSSEDFNIDNHQIINIHDEETFNEYLRSIGLDHIPDEDVEFIIEN